MNFTISQKILNRRHKELNTFMMPHAASASPSCLETMWVVLLTMAVGSLLTFMAECEGSRVDEREFFFCSALTISFNICSIRVCVQWIFASPCKFTFITTDHLTFPPWLRLVVTLRTGTSLHLDTDSVSIIRYISSFFAFCSQLKTQFMTLLTFVFVPVLTARPARIVTRISRIISTVGSSHLRESVTTSEAGTPETQRPSPGAASWAASMATS